MSYSRWNNSKWYTYWDTSWSYPLEFKLPTKELKNKQVFTVCSVGNFTYEDLIINMEECLDKVRVDSSYNKEILIEDEYTEVTIFPTYEEMEELETYIKKFKEDIDNHFKLWNFLKFEWYWPIKIKIKNKIYGQRKKITFRA